jgi:excisionase family DNA binding protein
MLKAEIRFFIEGNEVSLDSFAQTIAQQIRVSLREEISQTLTKSSHYMLDSSRRVGSETHQASVSVREAARLLGISPRTVQKYISLKAIRTVRIGRRVLVPMSSVNQVATKGIPNRFHR